MKESILLLCTVCILIAGSCSAVAEYGPGYIWERASDWTVRPDADQGTMNGNPDDDALGNAVWSYEWAEGGGTLLSATPWYTQPTQKLVWDADWYGHGRPAWARADDVGNGVSQDYSPVVFRDWMTFNLSRTPPISTPDQTPLVRWTNPTGRSLALNIGGSLGVFWTGDPSGDPVDVEVVLAKELAGGGFDVLFGTRVSKPHNDSSYENISIPVALNAFVDQGDSLILSVRGDGELLSRWIDLHDQIEIEIVPEPSGLWFLGCGVLVLRRWFGNRGTVR